MCMKSHPSPGKDWTTKSNLKNATYEYPMNLPQIFKKKKDLPRLFAQFSLIPIIPMTLWTPWLAEKKYDAIG